MGLEWRGLDWFFGLTQWIGLEGKGREWKGADWSLDRTQWRGNVWRGGEGMGADWIGSSFRSANDEW